MLYYNDLLLQQYSGVAHSPLSALHMEWTFVVDASAAYRMMKMHSTSRLSCLVTNLYCIDLYHSGWNGSTSK